MGRTDSPRPADEESPRVMEDEMHDDLAKVVHGVSATERGTIRELVSDGPSTWTMSQGDAKGPFSYESPDDARRAVESVLSRNSELARLVEQTAVIEQSPRLFPVWRCDCGEGCLHCVGRSQHKDGSRSFGGLFICDACGTHQRRA